ncbi:flavin monoamine oxidase family protein [Thermopolyspora sp. NPDC052614]|uniref:flavin monoamine oxidase family protein n=1 Tax=Thermopolyspora sp. NPDC052614 TaxID=3155682 RepID=UPI00341F586B
MTTDDSGAAADKTGEASPSAPVSPADPGRRGRFGALTRRSLLVGLGAAGGAGAMYAAMGALGLAPRDQARDFVPPRTGDFTLTGRSAAKVLILGAGVAGLACAYELGKAGYDCTVVEARDRIGGRAFTLRGGDRFTEIGDEPQSVRFGEGGYFNAGPARVAQWMVTMDYCRELGVPVEVFINDNAQAYVYTEGMAAPIRSATYRADMYGYISELLAKATDAGALDRRLTKADKELLLDFLGEFGDLDETRRYTGSERRGFAVHPGVAAGNPLAPVPSVSEVLGYDLPRALTKTATQEQAAPMFQMVGGMDGLVHALAEKVGADRVLTGVKVTKIMTLSDRVEVTCQGPDGTTVRSADYCVCTLPPHLAAKIPNNLGTPVTSALAAAQPTPAGKIAIEYDRRWWETEDNIFGGSTETDLDITRIWYPSYGFFRERGVIIGYYTIGEGSDVYSPLSHRERHRRALTQGKKIHGEKYRTGVLSSASVAWSRQQHIEGAWANWADPALLAALRRPAGRVYFAGDWLTQLNAWMAGALESARTVVTELHRRALAQTS